ncbi:MAG: hypothetical protein KF822_05715 [Steroidobacteraceae bacterium]|nr:hypothetical protein [Steroidobacteraceae bacterium]
MQRHLAMLACALLSTPAFAQDGALTVARNLKQLTERSAVIVRGNVVSARVEKHPELRHLDTVVVTLRVRESLKGDAGATFTFRQYVWGLRDRREFAGYRKGQHLLLMLIAPSRHGLSSPAGLEQGRFLISRDAAGRELAVNGRANAGLLEGVGEWFDRERKVLTPELSSRIESHRAGAIPLEELTTLIRMTSPGAR